MLGWVPFSFNVYLGNTRHTSTDSLIGIANGGYEDEKINGEKDADKLLLI